MDILNRIAEEKIKKAMEKGELTPLAHWKNKPLEFDDDGFVADDLKMAYKILKNSGHLPPELETRKKIANLQELIAATEDEHTRLKQMQKLNVLLRKLENQRSCRSSIQGQDDYYQKIVEKVSVRKDPK